MAAERTRRKWVCDASPLILLAKIGRADLLSVLSDELVIPEAVAREVEAGAENSPAKQWLRGAARRFVRSADAGVPAVDAWGLDPGERAVLSWAYEKPDWTAVVDDRAGRRCASALGIVVTGTIGVVLLAKEEKQIAEVKPTLEKLVHTGLRAGDALLERALRMAGEAE